MLTQTLETTQPQQRRQAARPAARRAAITAAAAADEELPTLWEGEPTALTRHDWASLRDAVPAAEPVTLVNRDAVPHPRTSAVCLLWPPEGELTTGEREAWSGHVIGTGRSGRIISPDGVADALHAATEQSEVGVGQRWECRWTPCGNWWLLRAIWDADTGEASSADIEAVIAVQHEVCSPTVLVHASWMEKATGAEIISSVYTARVGGRRLRMHRLTGGECINALLNTLDNSRQLLASWSAEGFDRSTLAAWSSAIAGPRFGRDVPARIMTEYDGRNRGQKRRSEQLRSVRDLAWRLARRTLEERDVDRRMRMQASILDSVSEVPWWNAPHDPDALPHPAAPDPASIH